jgi:carbonic anhydrase/acetyltransferase-like protein (isoleucine patch superfamily)
MDLDRYPVVPTSAYVAPTAVLTGDVKLGEWVVILFGVVLRGDVAAIVVGDETNIQDNSVLHGDTDVETVVGRRVTIGHLAVVHGARVGDGCLVGIGAKALTGSVMGEGSWLSAGAVLGEGKEIPPWTLAMGVPARPIRDLTEDEIARQRRGVDAYLRLADHYRLNPPSPAGGSVGGRLGGA